MPMCNVNPVTGLAKTMWRIRKRDTALWQPLWAVCNVIIRSIALISTSRPIGLRSNTGSAIWRLCVESIFMMIDLLKLLPILLRKSGDSEEARQQAVFAAWIGAVGQQ